MKILRSWYNYLKETISERVAQRLEHMATNYGVGGSNPSSLKLYSINSFQRLTLLKRKFLIFHGI